ncbi:MAG TPA: hypothetical protein PKD95_03730 [Candidatus Paceibacterota bacterium]|nr:hypothetical protein [Candidatus Paceibacterota bacterium]
MSKKTFVKNNIKLGKAKNKRLFNAVNIPADTKTGTENLALYKIVYKTKLNAVPVCFLLVSFLFQGLHVTHASSANDPSSAIDSILNLENEVLGISDESAVADLETPLLSNEAYSYTETDNSLNQTEDVLPSDTSHIFDDENSNDVLSEEENNNNNVNTDILNIENESINDLDNSTSTNEGGPGYLGEFEVPLDSLETTNVVSITNSAAIFSFNQDQCTELATGSFYCHKAETVGLKDALFAAADNDGDMEIFSVSDGVQTQITNNKQDDLAPYFDKNSNTIVWHRFINDRYQIISYDIDSQTETQLTRTNENNMEPTRQGKYTVWQRWVDGGWNIILFDGEVEEQLTKTKYADVAPYVHGSLVVWNRHHLDGKKTVEMYDIANQTYVSINDPDGLAVSNPRMVFVYDSLHPNGDIVTKGYDVLNQEFINLDTLPRNLPTEIPNNDSTGETRALIQIKPSLKSEVEETLEESNPIQPIFPTPIPNGTSTNEAINELTLDLSAAVTVQVLSTEATSTLPLSDFDLVIEPLVIPTEEGV